MQNILLLEEVSIPENIHLMILDATKSYQTRMVSDLGEIGFIGKITTPNSLAEAFEQFKTEAPDFILCESKLTDGIGSDLLKAIRNKSQLNTLPFLMISANSDIDNILEATNNGADGYLVKPWTKKDLIEQIAFAYSKRNRPAQT